MQGNNVQTNANIQRRAENNALANFLNLPGEPLHIFLRYVNSQSKDFDNLSLVNKFLYDNCAQLKNTNFGQLIKFSSIYNNQIKGFEKQYGAFKANQLTEIHWNNKIHFMPIIALAMLFVFAFVAGTYKMSQNWKNASIFATTLGVSMWFSHRPQLLNFYRQVFNFVERNYNNQNLSLNSINILHNMMQLDLIGSELQHHPQENAQTCIFLENQLTEFRQIKSNLSMHIEKARFSGNIDEKEMGLEEKTINSFKIWQKMEESSRETQNQLPNATLGSLPFLDEIERAQNKGYDVPHPT